MPNHYTNIVIAFDGDRFEGRSLRKELTRREWLKSPLHRVLPMPADMAERQKAYQAENGMRDIMTKEVWDWQVATHGCKWDAYDVRPPIDLPGDCHAVQLTFCTAWNPPNEATRDLLVRELLDEHGADRVVWLGLQPYDDTFVKIGEWEWKLVRKLEVVEG